MANSHPGSYCGQDAYNDMFVTEKRHEDILISEIGRIQGIKTGKDDSLQGLQECDRPHYRGGTAQKGDELETVVRRLTPTECSRLQGYPDGWVDIDEFTDDKGRIRKATDSAKYKALGNSIALPFWFWLLRRISAEYERPATLGSLFDGISGFPLCWERCNGVGTARWSSEVEPFCIAVAKQHFGDEDEGIEGDIRKYL